MQKKVPTCLTWFQKILKTDERVLVCSVVDREIVKFIQNMCKKCRENKQITLPEFSSMGFKFKIPTPMAKINLNSNSISNHEPPE